MKPYISLICLTLLCLSCQTKSAALFYSLDDFKLSEAKAFAEKIKQFPQIKEISIVDAQTEKNGYRVNGRHIFNDTLQANLPNFYSYKKLADELPMDARELNGLLSQFNRIKASEFKRDGSRLFFPVEKYALAKQKGYVFIADDTAAVGDTVPTNTVYGNAFILKKQVVTKWFQYESLK